MFNYKHYLPILHWKEAERGALLSLSLKRKGMITPLIEVVPLSSRRAKDGAITKTREEVLRETLSTMRQKIFEVWGLDPILIDFSCIELSMQEYGAKKIFQEEELLPLQLIPVVYLDTSDSVFEIIIPYIKENGSRICLRLISDNLANVSLKDEIDLFLTSHGLKVEKTDLVVDLKYLTEECAGRILDSIVKIPYLSDWHTFSLASGSFPKDLTEFDPEKAGRHELRRMDWFNWCELIKQIDGKTRKPSFADYTTQYPFYIDKDGFTPSASLRYTSLDKWIIMRGRSLRTHSHKQYLANANLLSKTPEFSGREFSAGDTYIDEKAKDLDSKNTGNPTTWLRAGINHHISFAADQVASFS